MLKAKLLKLARRGIKLLDDGDEYRCLTNGFSKVAIERREFPERFFLKAPLALLPTAEYKKDPAGAREKIKAGIEQLVVEGYLIKHDCRTAFYYEPTEKLLNNDNEQSVA